MESAKQGRNGWILTETFHKFARANYSTDELPGAQLYYRGLDDHRQDRNADEEQGEGAM